MSAVSCERSTDRPFGISDEVIEVVSDNAKDYALLNGIAMRVKDLSSDARVPLPFCLVPSQFPKEWFLYVKGIQKDMNYLIHKVANNPEFLKKCLINTAEFDEFTRHLLDIYDTIQKEGVSQPLSLGILRSDYMLDQSNGEITGIKLIENNTFASSLGGVAPKLRDLHMYVLKTNGICDFQSKLPCNNSTFEIVRGMISAWEAYGKKDSVILFVIEDRGFNICDQRALEFAINDMRSDIQVVRCQFDCLHKSVSLKQQTLFIGSKEVALVYYRYGYSPDHYTKEDWDVRLLIERSRAIKCPSVAYHLAGTKKVQVHLSMPGILEKFFNDQQTVERMRRVFAAHYALDMNEDGDRAVSMALENPHRFVMKPEREGGGNNLFGDDIKQRLKSIGSTNERQAYILMDRINSPAVPNYIVQRDVIPSLTDVMSELGIFGIILGTKDIIHENYEAGHLLRSKRVGLNEGGIAAGFGAVDSPYLT